MASFLSSGLPPGCQAVRCSIAQCMSAVPLGKVHKTRMEARAGDAAFESWRYLESGVMVVKSIFSDKGRCLAPAHLLPMLGCR